MGCFGYICKGCETQIVGDSLFGGELAKLIHVRDGEVIGQTEGHYDEYGRVVEDSIFRNMDRNNPNGHDEICVSEINLPTSSHMMRNIRVYKGEDLKIYEYETKRLGEYLEKELNKGQTIYNLKDIKIPKHILELIEILIENGEIDKNSNKEIASKIAAVGTSVTMLENRQLQGEIHGEYYKLDHTETKATSGIVAWHKKCYEEATKEDQEDLTPSQPDPNQSWGEMRDEFR